jgi:hypothetical protein
VVASSNCSGPQYLECLVYYTGQSITLKRMLIICMECPVEVGTGPSGLFKVLPDFPRVTLAGVTKHSTFKQTVLVMLHLVHFHRRLSGKQPDSVWRTNLEASRLE